MFTYTKGIPIPASAMLQAGSVLEPWAITRSAARAARRSARRVGRPSRFEPSTGMSRWAPSAAATSATASAIRPRLRSSSRTINADVSAPRRPSVVRT